MMKEEIYSVYSQLSALAMAIAFFLVAWIVPAQTTVFGIDEDFEALAGSLLPASEDPTILFNAPGLLGYTHVGPAGWTVTTQPPHIPGNGCIEWEGWSFVTNDFWQVAAGQGRELFVTPAGGIFAVADSDGWDQCGLGGPYDSTLASPAVTIPANATAIAGSFLFDWRINSVSIADAWYTIDGGPPIEILHLESTAPGAADLRDTVIPYTIPSSTSPRTVQVFFRYSNAINDWWVAIDDVQLSWTETTVVIPAVTTWGLIVMALLMLVAGTLTISRHGALISC